MKTRKPRKPLVRRTRLAARTPMQRGTKPIKPNAKRKRANFARQYGSKERVEFVKSSACGACGDVGYAENAHVVGVEGMGRKGHYRTIAPLCGPRWAGDIHVGLSLGCHGLFDQDRESFYAKFPDFDPDTAAAECERAWLAYQARNA